MGLAHPVVVRIASHVPIAKTWLNMEGLVVKSSAAFLEDALLPSAKAKLQKRV